MEQPSSTPNSQSQISSTSNSSRTKGKRKLPSARELIAHYESKGMETQAASLKVIEDLQNALFRVVLVNNNKKKKDKALVVETADDDKTIISRKLDVLNARLISLETKIDSKPGYPQTLAIGVASGALVRGIGSVIPHLAGALGHMWSAVRSATSATTTHQSP